MSAAPPREHWLDLLAARQTRRKVLKTALAGAALTLPFVRSAPGRAANPNGKTPNACQKGCDYTSHVFYDRDFAACDAKLPASYKTACGGGGYDKLPWYLLPVLGAPWRARYEICTSWTNKLAPCYDQALLQQQAMQYRCTQADCPGFDPEGPRGPCEIAKEQGNKCCPSQSSANGYIPCAVCCSPTGDGCGSGVTECGGGP
jgi:hypothetical protein